MAAVAFKRGHGAGRERIAPGSPMPMVVAPCQAGPAAWRVRVDALSQ